MPYAVTITALSYITIGITLCVIVRYEYYDYS